MASCKTKLKKINDVQKKIKFTEKFEKEFQCEKIIREAVNSTLEFLMHVIPFAKQEGFFPICDQLLRCSTSVSANLAEGRGRSSYGSLISFVSFARGSLFEVFEHLSFLKNILLNVWENRGTIITHEKLKKRLNDLNIKWTEARVSFQEDWNILLKEGIEDLQDPAKPREDDLYDDTNSLEIKCPSMFLSEK